MTDPRITRSYRKWIANISMWSVGGQLWVAAKDRFVDSNYDKQGRPIVNAFVTSWNQEDIGFWAADYACAQSIGLEHGEDWDESDLPIEFYDECLCAALEYFDAQHEKATIMLDQWDVPEGDTQ
jgi:hypothetical protein